MSAEIIRPFAGVTVESFVRDNPGVGTMQVAQRFGLWREDALKQLAALEKAGRVERRKEPFSYGGMGGRGNGGKTWCWYAKEGA